MSRQLQLSIPLVTLVKTEPTTVIKNEPLEEALEKEIGPDIKDIDIVYHYLSEDLIKNETVSENILETKYLEFVETQVSVKTEDTSDENVIRGTDQEVIEVQGSHEHCNTLSKLETHGQLVLNSSNKTTSWEKQKEKIKIITARGPVESHEYTSLVEDEHVCNYCQRAYKGLHSLEYHIRKMHRKIMYYQCPYCTYKSKWKHHIKRHIIQKHKDTKDIQWFQCNLCEMKFKLKNYLTGHMKVHLRHKQLKDGLDLREKSYHCDNCDYKTYRHPDFKKHNLIHLKPEEIEYFYCYHCSYKAKQKGHLKRHIFRHHFKNVKHGKRHHCDKCDYKTYSSTTLKNHKLSHLKPEEIQYFYCYHCPFKTKWKESFKTHIFIHFKKEQVKFDCYICNFVTPKRDTIIKHVKKHSKVQNKSEITERS